MTTAKAAWSAINSENISMEQTLDLVVELDMGLGGVESSFSHPVSHTSSVEDEEKWILLKSVACILRGIWTSWHAGSATCWWQ